MVSQRQSGIARSAAALTRGVGELLITMGVVVLLFCVYEVYVTDFYTERQQAQLGRQIEKAWAQPAAPGALPATALPGDALAVIRIPRIGMTGEAGPNGGRVVIEGVDRGDLQKGPGHYPGTALPGAVGNVVVSGHRTTYGAPFSRVDELRVGDAVVMETRDMWFTYRVTGLKVVPPTAIEVTYPVPGQRGARPTQRLLTLTTCNPRYSARERLVVHAVLDTALTKAAGQPPALVG